MPSYLDSKRAGARLRTTTTNSHTQLDQNAPPALQEELFTLAKGLAGVVVGPSHVSMPGARAFHLPGCRRPAEAAFMTRMADALDRHVDQGAANSRCACHTQSPKIDE